MKCLTATRRTQGDHDGDFCWTVDGELVYLGFVCDRDIANPDRGCGCGRAFAGLDSHHVTTSAEVSEIDIAVLSAMQAAGWIGDPADAEQVQWIDDMVELLLVEAASYPVGTVLGRRIDVLTPRT